MLENFLAFSSTIKRVAQLPILVSTFFHCSWLLLCHCKIKKLWENNLGAGYIDAITHSLNYQARDTVKLVR